MRGAPSVYFVVLLSVLTNIALRGSRVLVSLSALHLGANSFTVGVLAALFSVFPLVLAVHAGRVSDRVGVRAPIALGSAGMALALLLPALHEDLFLLLACPTLVGLSQIFVQVSIQNAVGSIGGPGDRTRNFATFSLGASVAVFIGPSLAGFSIDALGYRASYVVLASMSLAVVLLALAFRHRLPADAAAAFVVRLVMQELARRYSEAGVLTASLFIAAATYALFPLLSGVAMLVLVAFVLGLGLGSAQPLTIMLTYHHAPEGRSGEALGMRLTVNKI